MQTAIPSSVKNQFLNGFDDEHYLVTAIRQYLLTEAQREWLFKNSIEISDILNGRIEGGTPPEVTAMFEDWNAKIGSKAFGF